MSFFFFFFFSFSQKHCTTVSTKTFNSHYEIINFVSENNRKETMSVQTSRSPTCIEVSHLQEPNNFFCYVPCSYITHPQTANHTHIQKINKVTTLNSARPVVSETLIINLTTAHVSYHSYPLSITLMSFASLHGLPSIYRENS